MNSSRKVEATDVFWAVIVLLIMAGIVHAIVSPSQGAPKQTCEQSVSDPSRDLPTDASPNDRDAAYEGYVNALSLCRSGQ